MNLVTDNFLKVGAVYSFHLSAAAYRVEDEGFEIVANFRGYKPVAGEEWLVLKGEESGMIVAVNPKHVCLIEPYEEDSEDDELASELQSWRGI